MPEPHNKREGKRETTVHRPVATRLDRVKKVILKVLAAQNRKMSAKRRATGGYSDQADKENRIIKRETKRHRNLAQSCIGRKSPTTEPRTK